MNNNVVTVFEKLSRAVSNLSGWLRRGLNQENRKQKALRLGGVSLFATIFIALFIAQMILFFLHEILVLEVGNILSAIDVRAFDRIVDLMPSSPIHLTMAVQSLTAIRPQGMAMAGVLGDWLHAALPSIFLESTQVASGAWVSAVISRDSTVLSRIVTQALVEALLAVCGVLLMIRGLNIGSISMLIRQPKFKHAFFIGSGLIVQSEAAWSILNLGLSADELHDMGMGFVLAPLFIANRQGYEFAMNQVLPEIARLGLFLLGLGVFFIAFILVDTTGRLKQKGAQILGRKVEPAQPATRRSRARVIRFLLPLVCILPILSLFSSESYFGIAKTNFSAPGSSIVLQPDTVVNADVSSTLSSGRSRTPDPQATPAAALRQSSSPPYVVSRSQSALTYVRIYRAPARNRYVLTINGRPTTIRGVNYHNDDYKDKPTLEQEQLIRRDFTVMKTAGINVITGWVEFSKTTLKVAEEFEIRIVMPFDFDPAADYLDPDYRRHVRSEFERLVTEYRESRALLMWNIGGAELLERMRAYWKRPPAQLQAAADLEIELAAVAHQIDAAHPVVLAEPRDWYLPYIESAVHTARKNGQEPSNYLVYGMNFYGHPSNLKDMLETVQPRVEDNLALPIMVTEFAPFGLPRADRSVYLSDMWLLIETEFSLIGGSVYVFNPSPDPLNPASLVDEFNLVDANRVPVDDSLAKMGEMWKRRRDLENGTVTLIRTAREFLQTRTQMGGYPASRAHRDDEGNVLQYFLEGRGSDGQAIAYRLIWSERAQRVESQVVRRVIFNELGDFGLSQSVLDTYMNLGGYAKFGAPISDERTLLDNGKKMLTQDFAKGQTIVIPQN